MSEGGGVHIYIGYSSRLVRDLFDGRLGNDGPVKKKRPPKRKFLPIDHASVRPRATIRLCGFRR